MVKENNPNAFNVKENILSIIIFVYQEALIKTFHTSFLTTHSLCEFTALEHNFKRWFCAQKPDLNVLFKDFWYTKKSDSDLVWQIQSISLKGLKFPTHTTRIFNLWLSLIAFAKPNLR